MSGRQWTREELDRVHPLPEHDGKRHHYRWAWRIDADGVVAFEVGGDNEIWVDCDGELCSADSTLPDDVCLSVILASKGMDSMGRMAEWLDEQAACGHRDLPQRWMAFRDVAKMLRSGRCGRAKE